MGFFSLRLTRLGVDRSIFYGQFRAPDLNCVIAVIPEGVVKTTATQEQVPLLAILVQGDHLELDQVLEYLKNGIPVLIIRGTGFLADVLAYAYEEHVER